MATLLLTAVGTAIGGPIGGAIGAIIGQQADAAIFAPKAHRGPRLGDLAVQTSSYGSAIPKIFGRMRVAGTVIWATDLQEHRSTSGGGKGRPSTTSYSYSASFAVALSGRPIRSVGRIWADGKLLRGAAGDFKIETGFRLYPGDEEQEADPLIAAAEGIANAPAFRGIGYAMFENLQLADYGNRIPSLSFEVEAEPGPVAIGAIAHALSGGVIEGGAPPSVAGYAAGGDSIRAAIEGLSELAALSIVDNGASLVLAAGGGPPLLVSKGEADARAAGGAGGRTELRKAAAASVPDEVSIAYHDPAREWQTGLQRATLRGPAMQSDRIALPAALEAEAAKAFAEARLSLLLAGRATARLHLGWRGSGARPGMLVRIDGDGGLWRIKRWTFHRMVVSLELARLTAGAVPAAAAASPGRPTREADHPHGPTLLTLLDVPLSIASLDDRPRLLVAAAGSQEGWRRADLTVSFDGGGSWSPAGRAAAPAVMGNAATALAAAGSALLDLRGSVEVQLANDAMWLEGRSDAALAGGANLALIGQELIQYGVAEAVGERRFRLSRLLRGRRGTEWATGAHAAGEPFVLIDQDSLASIEPPLAAIGREIRISAHGIGDAPAGVTVGRILTGEALRPPSPVHLRAVTLPDGSIAISWVRRSRNGWTWLDGGDVPLGEEAERYRLRLSGVAFAREVSLNLPNHVYAAAEQQADGGGPLTIEVAQVGTLATSRMATMTVERP